MKKIERMKVQVFDIQAKMQGLLESIQPAQEKIQELDKSRIALVGKIKDLSMAPIEEENDTVDSD